MIRRSNVIAILLAAAVIAAVAVPSQADLYYLQPDSTTDWNILSTWNSIPGGGGTTPGSMSGNDFNTNGKILGTPSSNATFNGDTLTLSGGALNLRNGGGYTKTVSDLTATGSSQIYGNQNNTTLAVTTFTNAAGATTNLADTTGTTSSVFVWNYNLATLTGSGDFALSASNGVNPGGSRTIVLTSADAAGFTGNITWSGSNAIALQFGNGATFGGGLVTDDGTVSQITLDQDVTFASVTLNGTPLDPGIYTYTWLNGNYDTIFTDGGSGSITVVPEPASLGLLAAGALALVRRRRRSA